MLFLAISEPSIEVKVPRKAARRKLRPLPLEMRHESSKGVPSEPGSSGSASSGRRRKSSKGREEAN